MDESSKQSFEALKEADMPTIADDEEGDDVDEDDDDEEESDEVDDDGGGDDERRNQLMELDSLDDSQSETLAAISSSLQLPENDLPCDFAASSYLRSGVPVDYALLRPLGSAEFKDQVGVSHQQALVSVTAQAAQVQSQKQLQLSGCPELSPTSVAKSISSDPYATLLDQKLSPVANTNSACVPKVEQKNSSYPKILSPISKTPFDGFNWRKYGQKQVKSPQGSRSYYKCTYSDCCAKKIEYCDHSNLVIEVISKGQHNHDPPRRINCTRESRLALSAAPNSMANPVRRLNDLDSSTSSRKLTKETPALPEAKRQNSNGSNETTEIDIKEEPIDEPEPKRKVKKSNSTCSGSLFKPEKKPKFVVHAAGDVGISGDGYRWRKYGQKMVKGNPHPRNYYRCTSAGCPVRKHIENDVDNTSDLIITYKGVHDHDMPVPKKRHGLPSAPLVAASAPASMNNLQIKKPETIDHQLISSTQWSVDTEGELTGEALDTGEEKAMESARTLLSIGFEIKQC